MAESEEVIPIIRGGASFGGAGLADILKDIGSPALESVRDSLSNVVDLDSMVPNLADGLNASLPKLDLGSDVYPGSAYTVPDLSSHLPVYRTYWHQLVVIGNGFDLECGLPSRFPDFFAARHPQPIKHEPTIDKTDRYGEYRDDNAWDLILDRSENHNWYDVEGTIASWIGRKTEDMPLCPQRLKNLMDCLNDPAHKMVDGDFKPEFEAARRLLCVYGDDKTWDEARVLGALREELRGLEQDFATYLSDATNNNETYRREALKLAIELMRKEMPQDQESYDIETSILSFNYTTPFSYFDGVKESIDVVNVHGRLDGEIVFGIDGTGIMDDPLRAPFTKTYRLMNLDLPDTGNLVHVGSGNAMNLGTALIKFYGHSLGEADYSYFQALFDSVNLYEGGTRLIFYFRAPKNADGVRGDSQKAHATMMDKVIHLLTAYGASLDNKDHGRNLIHKLLLEGRLSVKELPDTMRKKEVFTENGITFS